MSLMVNDPLAGLEEIQRQAFYMLFDNLNTRINEISTRMQISDQDFADHTGQPYVETIVEEVEPQNFYEGHRPSLISAAVESYPNCAVWVVRATPGTGSEAFDHQTVYRNLVYVEVMVKSIEDEGEVNRRLLRTTEAVNVVMTADKTLGGTVSGFDGEPLISISDVFTRKERTAYGPHWFWQGARLEYAVRKEAVLPSSAGSVFRAGPPVGLDIDQA